ncbi:arginine deiminase [Clostridiales bacterium KA00134]|nr:arginine deiminase [Clostridiales bacterium KA00134]
MNDKIQNFSEIGKLKKVILHRPGKELTNLAPDHMDELLFDELPFLDAAIKEHDYFAKVLEDEGARVYYLEELAADSIKDEEIKKEFIEEFLEQADIEVKREKAFLRDMLMELSKEDLVLKMMEGTRKSELKPYEKRYLHEILDQDAFFVTKPMPNLYYTRDPFSLVGNSVGIFNMWSKTRKRESIFGKYIFKYHDEFKIADQDLLYTPDMPASIEGGDILILSKEVIAVGTSQRTGAVAIEEFAKRVLRHSDFKKVLVFSIPKKRAFMHLDTVFTMVDKDLFTLHPEIEESLCIYEISLKDGEISVVKEESKIEDVLKKHLEIDRIDIIRQGKGGLLDASREQWSDGYNTLAISPREVVVYDRNVVTNQILESYGVKLHIIKSGELSRGRGGPRCMSMPIVRE